MRVPQVSERIKEAPAQALRGVFAGIGQLLLITDKLRNKVPPGQDVRRAPAPRAAETVTDRTAATPAGPREEVAAAGEPAAASAAAPAGAPAAAEGATAEAVTAKPPTAGRAPAKPAVAKPSGVKPAAARPASARRAAAKPSAVEPGVTEAPTPPKRQGIRDFDKTGNVRVLGDAEDSAAPAAASGPVAAGEPVAAPEPASSPADSGTPLPNYDELSVASLRARLRNLDAAQVGKLADYERAHAARADVLGMYERRIAKLEAEA